MQHLDEGTLQAWLDHPRSGLEPSEVADIERHLATCSACSAELEALRGTDDAAHALLASGLDGTSRPSFDEVVKRARGHEDTRRARRRINTLAWAASLVVAIGVGWMSNDLYRNARTYEATQAPAPVRNESRDVTGPARSPEGAAAAEEREEAPVPPPVEAPSEPAEARAAPSQAPVTDLAGNGPAVAERRALADRADAEPAPQTLPTQALPMPPADDAADVAAAGAAAPVPADALAARQQAAAPVPAAAPPAGRVLTGVVEDEQGQPVTSAQVYVEGLNVGVLTREDGSYRLLVPTDDSVQLTVQRIGYRTEQQGIPAGQGDQVVPDFRLQQQALQLQEVVVTGTVGPQQRRALGNSVTELSAVSPYDWQPVEGAGAEETLGRSLATVPGLEVVSVEAADSVVRVRQDLGDGVILTLVQGRSSNDDEEWPVEAAGAVASARLGDLLVTATAPLAEDSLRALLDEVR